MVNLSSSPARGACTLIVFSIKNGFVLFFSVEHQLEVVAAGKKNAGPWQILRASEDGGGRVSWCGLQRGTARYITRSSPVG